MRFLCLCPTYGRPQLVGNALACFEAQDYPAELRRLLIYDDSGQLCASEGPTLRVISTPERFPSLTSKYNAMLVAADLRKFDAVALMDDDDIYGPQWLSSHAQALKNSLWSYSRMVWSTHRPPATSPTEPGLEASGGRFWACAALRSELLRMFGGFREINRPTFDQEHLHLWQQKGGEPGRPDDYTTPQYVYGWGRSPRHVSVEMGDRQGWYANYATHLNPTPLVVPQVLESRMDPQSRSIYANCWSMGGA